MRAIAIAVGLALPLVAPVPAQAADPAWHGNSPSAAPTLGIEATPSGNGYLLLDAAGGVFAHGDAGYFGSLPELRRTNPAIGPAPVVDLSLTRLGQGYWVLDEAGGIFTFGDATFRGSVPQLREQGVDIGPGRIIDLAPVGDRGYYLLDEHGGVFTFGDLQFHGSIPQLRQQGVDIGHAKPVALVPAGTDGYWMLDERGGVFSFGSARFHGSGASMVGDRGAAAFVPYPDGKGYYILETVGHIRGFGSAKWFGANTFPPPASAVDMAVHPDGTGYWVVANDGRVFTSPVRPPGTTPPPTTGPGPSGERSVSPPGGSAPPPPPPGPGPEPSPYSDVTGDVPYCEGDLKRFSAVYTHNVLFWVDVACGSDPWTDHRWIDGLTGPDFEIDTNLDGFADFGVAVLVTDSFKFFVVRLADDQVVCEGAAWQPEADEFGAFFSPSCIGSPPSFSVRSAMNWDNEPASSSGYSIDYAPDDQTFVGPVDPAYP